MAGEKIRLHLQPVRRHGVVSIHARDKFAARFSKARVECSHQARAAILQDQKAWLAPRPRGENLRAFIIAVVVYGNKLKIIQRLREDRSQRFVEPGRSIPDGHDYTDAHQTQNAFTRRPCNRFQASMFARITGVGKYIPERHIANPELEKIIPTSDAWIRENIGVKQRSVIDPKQTVAQMGTEAAREAVNNARREDIRLVICATNSTDLLYPATACRIAHDLGLGFVPGYDLQAGCTGFLYALAQARAVVETQNVSVLVIGTDALSTQFHWHGDRNAVLFGDGAGAVVISPSEKPGILAMHIGAEYSDAITLKTPSDASLNSPLGYLIGETERRPGDYYTKMNGRAIMKLSLAHVPKAMDTVLGDAGLKSSEVDVFLPHQTNRHVIQKLADHIGYPAEKIPDVLSQHGSLSTAVMPVSLHMALESGSVKPGMNILMTAYGAGFTFGAAVIQW